MLKKIFIVGAGEPGHEIRLIINDVNRTLGENKFQVIGFYDENKQGEEIFTDIDELHDNHPESCFVNSVGNTKQRERLTKELLSAGFKLQTLIHPSAYVAPTARIGRGVIVYPHVSISHAASIGDDVLINYQASISHGCTIGDHVNITPGARIAGNVRIGSRCFIGIGSVIKEKTVINEKIKIGASAVVVKNLEKEGTYIGNPATVMKRGN